MVNKRQKHFLGGLATATEIEADYKVGLTSEQVAERMKDGLWNKVPKKVTKSYWQIFCDNFFSFFNILLFVITGLMIYAGLNINRFFFVIVLAANIIIGLVTDIMARAKVDKLRLITDPKVRVVRDGKLSDIAVTDVVLSDIVLLKPGDQICADAVIVNGRLKVDESLITGEADSIEKNVGSQIYSGSYVRSGEAYARVVKIGIANYAESLQNSAKEFKRPKSELKRSTLMIFRFTGIVAVIFGLAMLTTYLVEGQKYSFSVFIDTVSGSMVAMIPSGLYLLTSVTLAVGVINLARKRMNVQELYCIEMLARVDTICFDKTGTLTTGEMAVHEFYNYSEWTDAEAESFLASLIRATKSSNDTARAIRNAYGEGNHEATAIIPFDSDYKYSAASFEGFGTFILGAPGFVDAKRNEEADLRIEMLAERGYRTLGLYHNSKPIKGDVAPKGSEIVAVIALTDTIKPDAKENIEWFKNNGVAVKVISGDDAATVSEIALRVGVPDAANYISMENVKDEWIPKIANIYTVFGRVRPEQKAMLISAMQDEGHKVAMTGDGVNDIIALKKADCSIAMASGSSAARNVAHIVSMDNDFSKLPDVVREGRRVINNLQRTASLFLAKTFFAIVVSFIFLISSWCGGFSYPFNTANMVVWETVTIGIGGFLLAIQPSHEQLRGSFMRTVLSSALPAGIIEVLSVCVIYLIATYAPSFMGPEAAQASSVITFTALSFCNFLRVCLPFDKYRGFVFGLMVVLGFGALLGDVFLPGTEAGSALFDLKYSSLEPAHIGIIVALFVVLSVIYFLTDHFVMKKVAPKIAADDKDKSRRTEQ